MHVNGGYELHENIFLGCSQYEGVKTRGVTWFSQKNKG